MTRYQDRSFNSLFELEESVLEFWKADDTFKKTLEKTVDRPLYSFYDGPPFITGLPHYATLLPSIAKDVIPRFQTMKGRYVRRVWGWDVHGLPAENQVEKQLGLKNRRDIEAIGVEKFIDACRQYVQQGSEQWQWYIERIGRWVDLSSAYRTDSRDYMETVIWIFKQLYDKNLIYQDNRVSLFCPRCATPLSKFEVTMDDDSYKEVEDPAIIVAFALVDEPTYLLAWTTTPWTLPANVAVAVDPKADYVRVSDGKKTYILAQQAFERLAIEQWQVLEHLPGSRLVGKKYQPLFPSVYKPKAADHQVYPADFVAHHEGTGIVHIAPGFGENDLSLGHKFDLSVVVTVDDDGLVKPELGDWAGMYYKKIDSLVIDDLKNRGLLVRHEKIRHSYPHCYRCKTPLFYKAQRAWYLSIEPLRAEMLEANRKINWFPEHFGSGRFQHNLETAPDWCISRTRYWGTPLPVWQTEDGSETIAVGSISELEKLSGQKIDDLHRPKIDEIKIRTDSGKIAHRVKEVLDCWFESGAMPLAQFHYPFENQELSQKSYPADFIIEYTGQLRGWFYYLHVLGLALWGRPAFTGVTVTGVLMGNDGRKMSKSYGNYPDSRQTIERLGAESLRLYFMGSKIMNGEDIAISEPEIQEASRLLQILHNSLRYFVTYANLHQFTITESTPEKSSLESWLDLRYREMTLEIDNNLSQLNFFAAARAIRPFVEDLSTWFIRRRRNEIVAGDKAALNALGATLLNFARAAAPILPFSAEHIWRTLKPEASSVHLENYPTVKPLSGEEKRFLEEMTVIRAICSDGLSLRALEKIPLRQAVSKFVIIDKKDQISSLLARQPEYRQLIIDELNALELVVADDNQNISSVWPSVERKKLHYELFLDPHLTSELVQLGLYRQTVRTIQQKRKEIGLTVGVKRALTYRSDNPEILKLLKDQKERLIKECSLTELKIEPAESEEIIFEA